MHDPNNGYGKKLMLITMWGIPPVLYTVTTIVVTELIEYQ